MAQRVQVTLVDDVTGEEGASTTEFGLDGVTYEIDLSEENEVKLRDALAEFVKHARRTGGRQRRPRGSEQASSNGSRSRSTAPVDRAQNQAIRTWARSQGLSVSERGRIPGEIAEAYQKAHSR